MAASVEYSRPRLCKQYKITEKTLQWLEATELIDLTWNTKNGLRVCTLAEKDRQVFLCAANSLSSFNSRNPDVLCWPFQRFLFLRFLQIPVDELYLELIQRNIISENSRILTALKANYELFIDNIPKELRARVVVREAPKTKEEKALFQCLLQICDISIAYETPELEQSFAFMVDSYTKEIVDCAVSTDSEFQVIKHFLAEVTRIEMSEISIAFYQSMFHDLNLMDNASLKKFMKFVKPSSREKLRMAMGHSIPDFRVMTGLDDQIELDQTLSVIKDHLVAKLVSLLDYKAPETEKQFNLTLKNLMLIVERMDVLSPPKDPGMRNLPPYLTQLKLEEQTLDEAVMFTLPAEIEKSESAE